MQHVKVSHALSGEAKTQANGAFLRPPSPPLDENSNEMKTSVCDEIAESVMKAANIEKQLNNSKVMLS